MPKYSKKISWLLAGVIIILAGAFSLGSAGRESQTIDEAVHLSAGFSYLKTGSFALNPEHPPLAKMLMALPLALATPAQLDTTTKSFNDRNEWGIGYDFIYHNVVNHRVILTLGRSVNILIFLLGGLLLFWFLTKIIDHRVALLGLTLYSFNPLFLAHSHYVTTDIGAAVTFLLALIGGYNYFRSPSWTKFFALTIFVTTALLTKFNTILLLPLFVVLYVWYWPHLRSYLSRRTLLIMPLVALIFMSFTIWAGYGFTRVNPFSDNYVLSVLPNYQSFKLDGRPHPYLDRFMDFAFAPTTEQWFAQHPVPAYEFFRGLADLYVHNHYGHTSYLAGQIYDMGWWYYFPLAFLIKTPLPFLLALIVSLVLFSLNRTAGTFSLKKLRHQPTDNNLVEMIIFLPGLLYFLWSLTSHINLGLRHLSPLYPILAIFIAYQINQQLNTSARGSLWRRLVTSVMILTVLETAIVFPNYMSYFNQTIGGPAQGWRYLLDSNLDWGQQLIELNEYLKDQNISKIYIQYFGTADLPSYGITSAYQLPTTEEVATSGFNGIAVISYSSYIPKPEVYSWLYQYQPTKIIGDSLAVFDLRK